MFCKWCGNSLQAADQKCPSCGRTTPPMSDCGGFYNLKHRNTTTLTQTAVPEPQKPVVVTKCPIVEKMEPKYARDRKAAKSHHAFTVFCFSVLLVLFLVSIILTLGMRRQIKELEALILSIDTEPIVEVVSDTTEENNNMEIESAFESNTDLKAEATPDADEENTIDIETESVFESNNKA